MAAANVVRSGRAKTRAVTNCVERTRIADPQRTWQARIAPGLVAVGDEELLWPCPPGDLLGLSRKS